jgi:hypothetical protein
MTTDSAACDRAEHTMVARVVTGNPPDDGPLQAPLCLCRTRRSGKGNDERGHDDECSHDADPILNASVVTPRICSRSEIRPTSEKMICVPASRALGSGRDTPPRAWNSLHERFARTVEAKDRVGDVHPSGQGRSRRGGIV